MAVTNTLQRSPSKPKFSVAIQTPKYQQLVNSTLGDPNRARRFVAAVTSAVAVNPALQECDAGTILSGALLGESLNLSPSPQLGHYYLVPYEDRKRGCKTAQFQMGYKGYIQLAIRSGQYRKLNVLPLKQGEVLRWDPMNEELEVRLIEDDAVREETPVVGYYAMFELTSGFRKILYWSYDKMLRHADRYSKAFSKDGTDGRYPKVSYADFKAGNYLPEDEWKYSSFWYKDFDGMASKTMLRQLISKWGVMSIDLQTAFTNDEAEISTDGTVHYLDTPDVPEIPASVPAEPTTAPMEEQSEPTPELLPEDMF